MYVDIQFVEQCSLALVLPVFGVLGGWLALRVERHLGVATDSALATRVQTGVNALAQVALGELQKDVAAHPTIEVKNAAVARALARASASFTAAAATLGITPATLADRVTGALAEKLPPVAAPLAVPVAAPSTTGDHT
jgi:hypothetical protein